jgi:hypothetical protein
MDNKGIDQGQRPRLRTRFFQSSALASLAVAVLAIGAAPEGSGLGSAPATAQAQPAKLPAPPASGVMGFVVNHFTYAVIQEKAACPDGPALRNREIFVNSLPPAEAERLQKKENEREFAQKWRATLMNSEGMNICNQYAHFPDRPLLRTVQSKFAWGLDLDGDTGGGPKNTDTCAHEAFTSPDGEKGIDNQAYRALGCKLEWRGIDGVAGDIVKGFDGFLASGEWSQVILLHGVDSLVNDPDVEVIYANTQDRPVVDSTGKFIWQASFTVSESEGRYRNLLHGRIVNGVLTTDPKDIKLVYFPGQNIARVSFDLQRGKLRLAFQPDGSVKGLVGGYQPIENFQGHQARGGLGTAMTAGIDCAGEHNTLKKYADGMKDPKTGQCTAISNALELAAVPAFVNDLPAKQKVARK